MPQSPGIGSSFLADLSNLADKTHVVKSTEVILSGDKATDRKIKTKKTTYILKERKPETNYFQKKSHMLYQNLSECEVW